MSTRPNDSTACRCDAVDGRPLGRSSGPLTSQRHHLQCNATCAWQQHDTFPNQQHSLRQLAPSADTDSTHLTAASPATRRFTTAPPCWLRAGGAHRTHATRKTQEYKARERHHERQKARASKARPRRAPRQPQAALQHATNGAGNANTRPFTVEIEPRRAGPTARIPRDTRRLPHTAIRQRRLRQPTAPVADRGVQARGRGGPAALRRRLP